jgi:hypothetical protein
MTVPIFTDMSYGAARARSTRGFESIVHELFGDGIVAVDRVSASDPQAPGSVLEQCIDVHVAKALGIRRIILENAESITVVAIQPVLCAEPEEPAIVLDNVRHSLLRQSLRARQAHETQIMPIGHAEMNDVRVNLRADRTWWEAGVARRSDDPEERHDCERYALHATYEFRVRSLYTTRSGLITSALVGEPIACTRKRS